MTNNTTVAWLDVLQSAGSSIVVGFHTDLASVPESDRPPYVVIDSIPTPQTPNGRYLYNWDAKALVWEELPAPPVPTPSSEERIAKLEQENSDMKSCLNEILMGGTA